MQTVFLAGFIGILLGLLGAGGSTITIPVFVYILGYEMKSAIAMSLFVVGSTSLIGSIRYYHQQSVVLSSAITLGVFTVLGTFIGAELSQWVSSATQLFLFGIVLLFSSASMYKSLPLFFNILSFDKKKQLFFEGLIGIVIGIITGMVGIGGGFLLVPALVLLFQLNMKQAVGTSLLIIFFNTIAGFIVYSHIAVIDWKIVTLFSVFSIVGMILSTFLIRYISDRALKKTFSIIVFIIGIFIIFHHQDRLSPQTKHRDQKVILH